MLRQRQDFLPKYTNGKPRIHENPIGLDPRQNHTTIQTTYLCQQQPCVRPNRQRHVWPATGRYIANKLLAKRLAKHGYFQHRHTPGLWGHTDRPIKFSLVVDDFAIQYVGKEHANHLLTLLR